jgi:predicted nucleic acid-binding protein
MDLDPAGKLLLDTTVYIDKLQGRFPEAVELLMMPAMIWHSTVSECELAMIAGLLNPVHANSAHAIEEVMASIEQRPKHRRVTPDREIWREAGMLAGLLSRLQQYGKAVQRRTRPKPLLKP